MNILNGTEHEIETFARASRVANDLLQRAAAEEIGEDQRAFLVGMAAYEVRDYSVALDHLLKSFALENAAETAARIAMCYLRLENGEQTEAWAQRAEQLCPKGSFKTLLYEREVQFTSIISAAYLLQGYVIEAEAYAVAAQSRNPADLLASAVLAKTLLAQGKMQEAQRLASASVLSKEDATLIKAFSAREAGGRSMLFRASAVAE